MILQSRGSYLQFGDTVLHPKDDVRMNMTSTSITFESLQTSRRVIEDVFLFTEIVKSDGITSVVDKNDFLGYIATL